MPDAAQIHALYLSHDGMTDPLGRSQVLPYLVGLAARGVAISLISCEKPERSEAERDRVREICRRSGIAWHPLTYHGRPPIVSTLRDVAAMRRLAARLHRANPVDLIHCRSYIPSLVGRAMQSRHGIPFIFDVRSFLPDERAESGLWDLRHPLYRTVYRFFKKRELDFLSEAGQIVCQTHAGAEILRGWQATSGRTLAPIRVIPCCADFDHFVIPDSVQRSEARASLEIAPDTRVVVYLGSIGTWYMLDEMLDLFRVQRERDPAALFLMVSRDDPAIIRRAAAARGLPPASVLIAPAVREEVPGRLAAADYALSFIRPFPSKIGSAPVKLGEFLATGLPVVTNGEVGDVAAIIADTKGGVLVGGFDDSAYRAALDALDRLPHDRSVVRTAARRWFDLDQGITGYFSIYRKLAETNRKTPTTRGACESSE